MAGTYFVNSPEFNAQLRRTVAEVLRTRRSDYIQPNRHHKLGLQKPQACVLDAALDVATNSKTGATKAMATVCKWNHTLEEYKELEIEIEVWNHSETLDFEVDTFGFAYFIHGHYVFYGDCEPMQSRGI